MATSQVVDQGFRIVSSVFAAGEVEPVRRAAECAPRSRAGSRHLLGIEAVFALSRDPRLINLATEMLGGSVEPFKATLFDKSPTSNWLVAWHQDLALPIRERVNAPGWGPWTQKSGRLYALAPAKALEKVVALRVHLDDSRNDNGPLRVLPGTHRFGRLSEARIAQLVKEVQEVECVVAAGGVIAMRPLLVHASSKSASMAARRVLHIEYAGTLVLGSGIELAVA
jgi:hypothetical protein